MYFPYTEHRRKGTNEEIEKILTNYEKLSATSDGYLTITTYAVDNFKFYKCHLSGLFAALGAILAACYSPALSFAESNPMFDHDVARNVFGPSVEVTVGGKIPDSFKVSTIGVQIENNPAVDAHSAVAQPLPKDARAQIISEFGDPTKESPLRTTDNAPPSFKGMMKALDAGDEQLAQQYAEQFQRYTTKLQTTNLRAVNFIAQAGREKELQAKERSQNETGNRFGALKAPSEISTVKQDGTNPGLGLGGNIPVDPEGKVQVYFFFNSSDAKSGAAAREIERLMPMSNRDKRIQFVGVSADLMGNQAAIDFKERYELSFPVIADTALAASLGVQSLPSIAFVSPTTQRAFVRQGAASAAEVKALVLGMQGGK